MPFPQISHLQFKVLACLMKGEMHGKNIRQAIAAEGVKQSNPAFYQLMARMEKADYVSSRYDQSIHDGIPLTECVYRITKTGQKTAESTIEFYSAK